jgi:hypothetical protein
MSDTFDRKVLTPAEREARKLFREADAGKAMTEHERAQRAFNEHRDRRRDREASHRPEILNNGLVTVSAPICRLQFTAAGLAEIAQGVHLVDQVGQVDECPVRRQIGIEDQPARLLGGFNHGIARENLHSGDESVEVDELRNLGLVVHECIGVQP